MEGFQTDMIKSA